jgi:predicted nucleic acid-binding protein
VTVVLVDTSVWRRYFAAKTRPSQTRTLADLLDDDDAVLSHDGVIGELVLDGLSIREEGLMRRLPRAPNVPNDEVLEFVRVRKLPRRGIGWIDAHLLASTLVASAQLWTFDKPLAKIADELGAAFRA